MKLFQWWFVCKKQTNTIGKPQFAHARNSTRLGRSVITLVIGLAHPEEQNMIQSKKKYYLKSKLKCSFAAYLKVAMKSILNPYHQNHWEAIILFLKEKDQGTSRFRKQDPQAFSKSLSLRETPKKFYTNLKSLKRRNRIITDVSVIIFCLTNNAVHTEHTKNSLIMQMDQSCQRLTRPEVKYNSIQLDPTRLSPNPTKPATNPTPTLTQAFQILTALTRGELKVTH